MRTLAIILVLVTSNANAQTPDGKSWHDLPPQMNLAGAGFNGEHGAKLQRASIYTLISGVAIGGMLAAVQGDDLGPEPLIMGGMCVVGAIHLNLRGLKWEQRSYKLMQMGYTPNEYYDTLPDSVSAGDRAKLGSRTTWEGRPFTFQLDSSSHPASLLHAESRAVVELFEKLE